MKTLLANLQNNVSPPDTFKRDPLFQGKKWNRLLDTNMFLLTDENECICSEKCWCEDCKEWYYKSTTVHNFTRHAAVHSEHWKQIILNKQRKKGADDLACLSQPQKQKIEKTLTRYFVLSGQPFIQVEDEELKELDLPDRKALSTLVKETSLKVIDAIKDSLSEASTLSIAIDEWTDQKMRKYLGVTARALINLNYEKFVLALEPIYSIETTAEELNSVLQEVLEKYNIKNLIRGCSTDSAAVMIALANLAGIWRCPCLCHIFNTVFEAFIDNIECQDIIDLVNLLNKSTKYTAFCNKYDIQKVPSYIKIRWVSICKTIISHEQTKNEVIRFLQSIEKTAFAPFALWTKVSKLVPIVKLFERIILSYENDEFGAISYFERDMQALQTEISKLSKDPSFLKGVTSFNEKKQSIYNNNIDLTNRLVPIATFLNPGINMQKLYDKNIILDIQNEVIQLAEMYQAKKVSTKRTTQSNDILEDFLIDEVPEIHKSVQAMRNDPCKPNELFEYWQGKLASVSHRPLACVAFDVLGILCTTCSTEKSFSKARNILNYKRLSLKPETANAQAIITGNREIAKRMRI